MYWSGGLEDVNDQHSFMRQMADDDGRRNKKYQKEGNGKIHTVFMRSRTIELLALLHP